MSEWLPAARALGILLLALAVVWPQRPWQRWVVAAAGASALTLSARDASFAGRANEWAVVLAVVVALAGWWAVPHARAALAGFGGSWWVLLGSAAAVYGCVPETDQMREVAVVVAAGGVVELLLRRPLPAPTLAAAFGLVEWSALYGATGQARALAGGLFALTPLVAVAAVATLHARSRPTVGPAWLPWSIAATWVVAALTMARTGGIATSLRPAAWAAAVCGAAAAAISAVLVRLARR
jgi:hypothetical protein